MPSRLILNADDFGLTPGINRAIAELHRAGVLTSATLMATGPAFADAIALAHSLPTLGVGCHIVLTDGTPASLPSEIPTLLGPDRRIFRPTLGSFVRDLLLNRINPAEIAHEAAAQIQLLQRNNIRITHIDTHKHTHLFPAVTRALLTLPGLPAIRNPFEPAFARRVTNTSFKRRVQIAILNRLQPTFNRVAQQIRTTDGTIGVSATGTLNAETLHQLLNALPQEGTYEIVCHPGYNDADLDHVTTRLRAHREIEYQALLTELPKLLKNPQAPQLIHYGNLEA